MHDLLLRKKSLLASFLGIQLLGAMLLFLVSSVTAVHKLFAKASKHEDQVRTNVMFSKEKNTLHCHD